MKPTFRHAVAAAVVILGLVGTTTAIAAPATSRICCIRT